MRYWIVAAVIFGGLMAILHVDEPVAHEVTITDTSVEEVDDPDTYYEVDPFLIQDADEARSLGVNPLEHVERKQAERNRPTYDFKRLSNRAPAVACEFEHRVGEAAYLISEGHGDMIRRLGCIQIEKSVEVSLISRGNRANKVILEIGGEKFMFWVAIAQFQHARDWAVSDECGAGFNTRDPGCVSDVEARFVYEPKA